jgi:hypothetical protein
MFGEEIERAHHLLRITVADRVVTKDKLAVDRSYRIPDQTDLTITIVGAVRRARKRRWADGRHHPLRLMTEVPVKAFQRRVVGGAWPRPNQTLRLDLESVMN